MQKLQSEIRQCTLPFNPVAWIEKKYRLPPATAEARSRTLGHFSAQLRTDRHFAEQYSQQYRCRKIRYTVTPRFWGRGTMIILPPNQPRIIIRDELVNETRIHRASGIATILHDPPCRMFFIDLIDLDGDHVGVWDGLSYAAAIAAAEEWRRNGGASV